MKVVFAFSILVFALGCQSKEERFSMPGAYRMVSQQYRKGGKDSAAVNLQQLKIYTANHMMYTRLNPSDSMAAFGVATWQETPTGIRETVIYSASAHEATTAPHEYDLKINRKEAGYEQVIPNIENNGTDLVENYEALPSAASSSLEGAWEGVMTYEVEGSDTTRIDLIQYKAYRDGYFMYAHTYVDSVNVLHTGMGYGTFSMIDQETASEKVLASNVTNNGEERRITFQFQGPHTFIQTWARANGTRRMEVYRRLERD